MEERKLAGILLIILTLSLELNHHTVLRVATQAEDFASRLENYLGKALPDDLLAEECEYVVPEGFNLTLAERLWRDFSFHVSAGYTTDELRSEVGKIYGNHSLINTTLSDGETVALNLSSISVERSLDDGSVNIRIPVSSSMSLNYTRYNFTKKAGFYEAWNKTLVREYRVWRREQGWYRYTMRFLETNNTVTIVSKIWGREALQNFSGVERVEWTPETGEIPIVTHVYYGGTIMVAVPGHYEDVRVIVPQQEKSFKVLFPAYDPIIIEGWVVTTSISSTSLSVGETLEIAYSAEYFSLGGEEPEPLNATLVLSAPSAFEPLNSLERKLNSTHTSGVFRLKAVKPGTYNLTLMLDGNASFSGTPGNEMTYTVQVVSPPAPSLSVTVKDIDTSLLKHAKLKLEFSNNGGGPAKNIRVEITGTDIVDTTVNAVQAVSRDLGSIEAGETREEEFVLRLLRSSVRITVKTSYSDDDGNPYLVKTYATIYHPNFWVPEHFETYTVIVPEHEETMRVFVPGYEHATHIRLYALWDPYLIGEARIYMRYGWVYEANRPVWGVGVPTHTPSLGLDSMPIPGLGAELPFEVGEQALTEAGVKIMVTSIEPYYKYLGVLKEGEALSLVNVSKDSLRSGNVSTDFRVEPLKPYWVEGKPVVLNATQLALYQAVMNELKKANPDIDYEYRETVADVRTRVGTAEAGCVTLVYHPLKIVGEGPLKTVRVRNFAAVGLDYRVNVETFIPTVFGRVSDENGWKHLCLNGMEDAVLLSSSLDSFSREVDVNLACNGRLVAQARFILDPESSPFWRGFWDGLASQAWKIALTGVIMVVLSVASKGTVGALALKLSVLVFLSTTIVVNSAYQYRELGTLLSTAIALKEVRKSLRDHASEFNALGYYGAAGLFEEAGAQVQQRLQAVDVDFYSIADFLSRACTDFSLKEWGILLGLEEAGEYEKGLVWGKTVGTAISLAVFVAGFYSLATSGATPSSLGAKAKTVLKGIWNWITPAMTDAVSIVRNSPQLAKGFGMLLTILSDAGKLGYSLIDVLKMDVQAAADLASLYGGVLEKILDAAKRRRVSDNAVQGVVELCSRMTGLGEEALSRLGGNIEDLLSKNEDFAGEFFEWAYGAKANPEWFVEATGKLSGLGGEELGSLRNALSRIRAEAGDGFENGVKLFDTYFKIPDSHKSYGIEAVKEISNAFLENVEKDGVKALEAWVSTLEYSEKYQVLVVPASIKEIEIGGEIRRYPIFPKTIVDATGMKSEGNIITIFVSKDGEAYNILGELGGLKSSEGVEVYPVYPQEVLQREGRFADVFGLSKGDYVIVSKGAVEPDFFFFTEKAKGEKVKVKLTSIWGEKFIEAHGFRECFLYYRRIGEQGLHHAIKGFEDEEELGKYITLLSHGEGLYVLRLEPVAWDMFFGIIKSVNEEKLKIPISYEPDPSTGKGRITIEIEDSLTRGLRKTLASGVYEYAPYLRVGEIEGGLKWDIPLGEAGGQMKALRIGVAIDDSGNLYYDVEYSPDYDPENLGGTHWFQVEEARHVSKPFGTVMEIHHEGGTRHLLFDSSSGLFKGEFIGPRDSEYEALSKYIRDALSNSKISGPFYDSEGKVWRIRIEAPEIFREAWAYGDSLLSSHGKGTLSTEIVRDFPMKRYPEHFGNVDPNKIEIDMTGQNLEEYWFDMLERDWTAKKLFFIGEAKSEWREWRPYSMLKYATDDLIKHVESVRSWKLPIKGYVFAIYMGLEIEIWWQEVDLSSIGE